MKTKTPITRWQLAAFYPYTPVLKHSVEVGTSLSALTPWIDAQVPGSIPMDLHRAGWIANPYQDMNSLQCEWIENKWWIYRTEIDVSDYDQARSIDLVFTGMDYKAHVFIDDVCVAEHENMVAPCTVSLNPFLDKETITVKVLFEHAPDLMGQIGYTSRSRTQKSRFYYKWDFCTRMVNVGLFGEVYVSERHAIDFDDIRIQAIPLTDGGRLILNGKIKIDAFPKNTPLSLRVRFDQVVIAELSVDPNTSPDFHLVKEIAAVEPWWPHTLGEPTLYPLELTLYAGTEAVAQKQYDIGFKTLELIPNTNAPSSALPYTFVVNGEKMYVKGVNITPLDVYLGEVDAKRVQTLIETLVDAHVNLIRVWGGGIIESELFYRLCNQHGILVWQEFMQSSSGIDNIPGKEATFLQALEATSLAAIKRVRNYVSLAVYSGGNELTDAEGVPSTFADENLHRLRELVKQHDPLRPMYPTSGSGPLAFGDPAKKGQNHDVHGHWKYLGIRDHYTYFNTIDSLFHSEFGVDGMCDLDSMRQFLSPEHLGPYDMESNVVWRHHGEWWDTRERDEGIFGSLDTLEDRIVASQFIQAEGLRYALEANRRRAFQNSGSIIWQANEPYPNISCTSLIDYYMRPKPVLFAVKKAFAPINPNLKYGALVVQPGDTVTPTLYVTSDREITTGTVHVVIRSETGVILDEKYPCVVQANQSLVVDHLTFTVPKNTRMIVCDMHVETEGEIAENTVLWLVEQDGHCAIEPIKKFLAERLIR